MTHRAHDTSGPRPMRRVALCGTALVTSLALAACEPAAMSTTRAAQVTTSRAAPAPVQAEAGPITLQTFTRILAQSDEAILAQGLEVGIAAQSTLAEAGAFEPIAYATIDRRGENSQTSAAEFLSQGGTASATGQPDPFSQYETAGRVGVQMRDRTGINFDLFYEISQVSNSLQASAARPRPEYFAAAGVELRAPLLRGAGQQVNTSSEVVAEIEERIAAETVRLVKSQRAFEGITAFMLVQRAQEQVGWRERIAGLAAELETEMERQVAQGLRSQTDLIEAQAQRAQRESELTLARQELTERLGQFQLFFSGVTGAPPSARWTPRDGLAPVPARYLTRGAYGTLDQSFTRRPEARINALRVEREEVLRLVAENLARPQADVVLDFRKTQLDGDYIPFRDVYSRDNPFETWRIGFEFRRGLQGDRTAKADLEAARLREQQAELAMSAFRQRIASELSGIGSVLDRARERLAQQDRVIAAQRDLLAAEETALANGTSSELEVVARRINLAIAQEQRADAIVQLNLASYLASQVDGSLLERLGIT